MAAETKLGAETQGGDVTYPASVKGHWLVVHSSLDATAETSTVLMRPSSYSNSAVFPARIHPSATRVSLMARYATGTTTVTTSPKVRVFGVYGPDDAVNPSTGVIDEAKAILRRLDSGTSSGAGITLTLTTAASVSAINDATYRYSDEYDITGIDLRGAKWLLVLTETAASVSGGANTTVACMAMVTN